MTPGPRQVLNSVILEGLEGDEHAAGAQPKAKSGARLTARLEDKIRTRTEENLRRMGFWEAEVLEVDRQADGAKVDLLLRVDPGAMYRLDLETPPESVKIAERAFPDPADGLIHPAQTEALAEEVQEHLQESGYLLADVSAQLKAEGDDQVLRLEVHPGIRYRVAEVEFPGAQGLQAGQLRNVVLVREGKTGGRFNQRISNATLEADRTALRELYYREGYPYAEIGKPQLVRTEKENAVRI